MELALALVMELALALVLMTMSLRKQSDKEEEADLKELFQKFNKPEIVLDAEGNEIPGQQDEYVDIKEMCDFFAAKGCQIEEEDVREILYETFKRPIEKLDESNFIFWIKTHLHHGEQHE